MTDDVNQSVEEQTLQGEPQPTDSGQEHNDVSQEAHEGSAQKRNDAEYNWAEMRRQRERDREELEALKAQLNKLQPEAPVEEEDYGVSDDDLLEGRHLKDLKKEIKSLKSELKKRDSAATEERIQRKFPDFEEVVNKESIAFLNKNDPELAKSLSYISDPYAQAVAAYKLLKKVSDNPNASTLEKKKALENTQKPVSVNAVTKQSAIGNAHLFENGLTPELKKSLWKEMQDAMKAG